MTIFWVATCLVKNLLTRLVTCNLIFGISFGFWFGQFLKVSSVILIGWLVDLGLTALWDSISVYIGPSPKERAIEERNDRRETKKVQTTPPAPTVSTVGPCLTLNQINKTPRHWKFTQHPRTTRLPRSHLELNQLSIVWCWKYGHYMYLYSGD